MKIDQNDIKQDKELEDTYYILLSLCREYSVAMINQTKPKEDCLEHIKQIRNDIKQLSREELISKTKSLYSPLLEQMRKKYW